VTILVYSMNSVFNWFKADRETEMGKLFFRNDSP